MSDEMEYAAGYDDGVGEYVHELAECEERAERAEALVRQLTEALRKYAWHVSTCPSWDAEDGDSSCDCGFEAAYHQFLGEGSGESA